MRWALILSLLLSATVAFAAGDRDRKKRAKEAQVHLTRGLELMGQGQFEDALLEFQSAEALAPSAAITQHVGECHEALGNLPEALTAYKRYLEEAPTASDAENVRKHIAELEAGQRVEKGRQLVGEKKYGEAIVEFQEAQKGKPDPKIWYEIGNAQDLMGDEKSALESYEKFLQEAPDAPEAGDVKGRIASLAGKKMKAPPPPPPPPKPVQKPFYTSKPGMALSIGGLLLAVGGGATFGIAASSNAAAPTARSEREFYDLEDRARTLGPVGIGLMAAGVVALAAGIVLLYYHTRPRLEAAPAAPAGPQLVPASWMPSLSAGDLR